MDEFNREENQQFILPDRQELTPRQIVAELD